mgnify:CR=1 FL=1
MDEPHLLIVDDDERIRGLLQKFLMRSGFLVSTARDAAHARRVLSGLEFDLIVLDIMRGEDLVRLTATENQLMRIFSAGPNDAVSRESLVEQLGRSGGQAQERAVDVQITRLRRKLETDPKQPRYLQTVRGAGYMLAPD